MKLPRTGKIFILWRICTFCSVNALLSMPFPRKLAVTAVRTCGVAQPISSAYAINDDDLQTRPMLTVVIPAFDEASRIQSTLEDIDSYLMRSTKWRCSRVLVVDDGSSDGTADVVQAVAGKATIPMECMQLETNQGKGAALSFGMLHTYQHHPESLILAADADGSAEISCLENLYAAMELLLRNDTSNSSGSLGNQTAMVVGYRTQSGDTGSRMGFRKGFRFVVRTLIGDLGVSDSQCGFKLMTASTGHLLYKDLNLTGWSHDVEVLFKCRELGIPLAEGEVFWQDKDGSKLAASPGGIWAVTLQMLLDVILMRFYWSKTWKETISITSQRPD